MLGEVLISVLGGQPRGECQLPVKQLGMTLLCSLLAVVEEALLLLLLMQKVLLL